ncbi:MAG: transposase [Bdellovibrionales bacterium]
MPRTRNTQNTEYPYHILARTNDRQPFPCALEHAWVSYENALMFYSRAFSTRILAFVMMKNHFHLLMSTPEGNLSDFMKHFMKRTSEDIRISRGIRNHLYGDRYYATLIDRQSYFQNVIRYVYQNPLRAEVCNSVLDYPYSTLKGFLGLERMRIPIFDDFHFFDGLDQNLRWLDDISSPEDLEPIRYGLRQQVFKPKPNKSYYAWALSNTKQLTPFS